MWIDISPLKTNRDFRYLYFGQSISFFGTMLCLVALPYQVYHLTNSTFAVGMLGIVELIPLLFTAFIGGALADIMDKRTLLIRAETAMAIGCLLLVMNALLAHPLLWVIFIVAGLLSALNGLHRPALDATTQRLVKSEEIQSASILVSLKGTVGMIGGPAVAGLCIAHFGLAFTYSVDFFTFILSLISIYCIKSLPPNQTQQEQLNLKSVYEAIHYAKSRQELLGTYIVDFSAMVFAMPNALFPAIAQIFGGTKILGWLYSAPAIGALFVTLLSGWTKKIKRHGAAVICAATLWGLAMSLVGIAPNIELIITFLILAGAADSVSGIFRVTLWNETIPNNIRGRMASLEMLSYMSGPLLGNAQVGLMASITGVQLAIMIGGILCVLAVFFCALMLPEFWRYQKK
jgi:MFS family permease